MLSMMGGLVAFGFIGLVLGPVIAAAVVTLLTFAASES
jgi:predicted PurR-regulated permease PerM